MNVRVVDMEYQEQTEEWAKNKYSIDWERANVAEGEAVWRLVELWEKTGTTSVITQTLDVEGNPKPNVIATFRWRTAEQSDIAGPNDWWNNYVYGLTNENGEVGPSMGTGAYRGEGEPCVDDGPHQIWIHDDNIKSDLLKCICMLAGTFHDHLDCKFKLMTGGEPEPPEPPVDGELLDVVKEIRDDVADIKSHLLKTPPDPEPPKGYFGQYFNNRNLEGAPVVERWDSAVHFDWGTGPPAEGINADNFSVRWTATRHFEAGIWRFHVRVDDGVRLFVDGQLLIDKWVPQAPTEYTAIVVLSEGEHSIKMEYFEHGGGSVAQMWYHKV